MPSDDSFKLLTDEQLTWLFINELIDMDDKLDNMCPKCREDATSKKCIRCGKKLQKANGSDPEFINPNFDYSRFSKLASEDYDEDKDDLLDVNLAKQLVQMEE